MVNLQNEHARITPGITVELDIIERFLSLIPLESIFLQAWLVFSFLLFFIGIVGILFNVRDFLITILSIELIYLGAISSFVLYSVACRDISAAVYALLFLILAACESAVGLGLLIILHRFERTVEFDAFTDLGG
jgi:NADH-quinone oxidoreductase subunit K